ncbi:MAG: NAD(+) synthase [Oscillospiraceae bacterium]|nr:NAD(+) synthase [Oscillospiraceae bacterium]
MFKINNIHINVISNKIELLNPDKSTKSLKSIIQSYAIDKTDEKQLFIVNSNFLTGNSCGDIIKNNTIQNMIQDSLKEIKNFIIWKNYSLLFSQDIFEDNILKKYLFIINNKKIFAQNITNHIYTQCKIFDTNFIIFNNIIENIKKNNTNLIHISENTPIISISSHSIVAGDEIVIKAFYKKLSKHLSSQIILSNGGYGESTYPYIYKSYIANFNKGDQHLFLSSFNETLSNKLKLNKIEDKKNDITININKLYEDIYNDVTIPNDPKTPYIHGNESTYLKEVFNLQVESLKGRLLKTNITRVILGLSGGLDSTLSLLVCVKAFKDMNISLKNIACISMPSFGTTKQTFDNGKNLADSLNISFREINISKSVEQHFIDIGHDIDNQNTVFENAQARERSQILFDISNIENAIVVGTGNLSEAALGFSTFTGDHMAHFNVNICVTKTMIRKLIQIFIDENIFSKSSAILNSIIQTPISPELLPPKKDGSISQRTEDIIGPYELHDIFLYLLIIKNMDQKNIIKTSYNSFKDTYSIQYVEKIYSIFIKRFFTNQFKRSCVPDGSIITNMNLSTYNFFIPSDYYPAVFMT